MPELKDATRRVAAAAAELGLDVEIVVHAQSTRTAEEAAAACGCSVGQIVKSLVFRGATSGKPVLLLVSGVNRVDEAAVTAALGEALTRPDARYVRDITGFAIGGIPPFGHASPLTTFIDEDLLKHEAVWAAAGTPDSVFRVAPGALADKTGATRLKVTGG
jgi:prolyl-tRNA editing enzyme YbaK/EbsC (Cys-tRNA(Pro) deacylase)